MSPGLGVTHRRAVPWRQQESPLVSGSSASPSEVGMVKLSRQGWGEELDASQEEEGVFTSQL